MQINSEKNLHNFKILQFQTDLINWFITEQRDLPWRKNRDPYKIWISEIMLQQTRVETVIPYFNNFIEQFPTMEALASADEEKVLKAWEGLGYYSRARNLQCAVKEVVSSYGGKVPNNVEDLSKLKGVGPYTQGAILSLAYGIPEPAVDGNVMRVLARILNITEDIAKAKTRKIFEQAVREIISIEKPSEFNQGLMELGAIVCTPRSPSCFLCPVQDHCYAFHADKQDKLPIKTTKKSAKEVLIIALVVKNQDGKLFVQKRPSKGLLANLWELPNFELKQESIWGKQEQLHHFMKAKFGTTANIEGHLMDLTHSFSHLTWKIAVYQGFTNINFKNTNSRRFISLEEIAQLPFPVPYQKILTEIIFDGIN